MMKYHIVISIQSIAMMYFDYCYTFDYLNAVFQIDMRWRRGLRNPRREAI